MGGGVIRATTKAAGFTGGIRGVTGEHFPVSSLTRRAGSLRPAASVAEDVKLVASNSDGGLQRPSTFDDWVFAGGEEDAVIRAGESMPRLVFGGVPSIEEAREATSELTVALEKTYLSSNSSAASEGSVAVDDKSGLHLSNSQVAEIKPYDNREIVPSVPSPAIMAFKFLKENPVAQNVVASIASDPNVWNSVLQNQELRGFLQSQRTSSDVYLTSALVVESNVLESVDNSSKDGDSEPSGGFMDILEKIKSAVVDMMSSLSDFFVNLFGGKGVNVVSADSDGTVKSSANTLLEASVIGLAVMAILVILLKRG